MKKGLSLLLSLLMVISMFSCLSVVASAATSDYALDTEYTVLSGEEGVFVAPEAGYYNFASNGDGDPQITIYDGDGYYITEFDDELDRDFYGTLYLEENEAVACSFHNYRGDMVYINFTITKVENNVASIQFTLADNEFVEETNGWWQSRYDEEDQYQSYFYYEYDLYSEGNVLIVTYNNGSVISYESNGYSWCSENGDILDNSLLEDLTNQEETPWTIGSNNYMTVSYFHKTASVQVTVVENPVESIAFEFEESFYLIYETDGYWSERYNEDTDSYEDYFCYHIPSANECYGNTLTVNYKDGRRVEYVYTPDVIYDDYYEGGESGWISSNGELLDEYDVYTGHFQEENPWVIGDDNEIIIEFMNRECIASVSVKENPVEEIEFTPVNIEDLTLVLETDGEWDERYNEETDQYEEYFYYYTPDLERDGNILTVHYTDGTSVDYIYEQVYDAVEDSYYSSWFTADGKELDYSKTRVGFYNYQEETPWALGSDNYITVEYMYKGYKIPVTIVENPVESIEFIPKNGSVSVFENKNGVWRGYWDDEADKYVETYYEYDFQEIVEKNGNAIKVNYTDNTTSTYYYDSNEYDWIDEFGETLDHEYLDFWTEQWEGNPWSIGENWAYVEYYGEMDTVTVKVLEPVDDVTDGNFTAEVISETECYIIDIAESAVVNGVLTIPEAIDGYTVTGMKSWLLYELSDITEINLPSGIYSFSKNSFNNCDYLEKVNVAEGNSVYASRNGVVYNKAMTEIVYCPPCYKGDLYIPAGVEELDNDILAAMGNASSVIIDENNPNFVAENGIIYNSDFTKIIKALNLPENYVMKSTVTEIGECAFSGNTTVKNVTVNSTVTEISYGAFMGCSSLEAVALPEGLITIGYASFENSGIKSITLPSTVECVLGEAFLDCSNLASVSLNNGLTDIGYSAFRNTSLSSIVIPDSVSNVGSKAFYDCDSLTNVVIGSGLSVIGSYVFAWCGALKELNVPATVESIYESAIRGCSRLERINVAADNPVYSSIDGVLFNKNASSLYVYPDGKAGAYTIPSTVNYISSEAFDSASITSVVIPDTVQVINPETFIGCTSLTQVVLSENLTEIDHSAFERCSSLTEINIPASVTYIDGRAFIYCTALKAINVAEANTEYASQNGILYTKDKATLVLAPYGIEGAVVVPQGTEYISAFADCKKVTSIVLPEGLTSIGGAAFSGCTSLTEINIPDTVTNISYMAFSGCSSLNSIKLPSSLTKISWATFSNCTSLKAIEIPASVTYIEERAFYNCTSLTDVYFTGTEEQWNAIEIEEGNDALLNATIHFNSFMPDANTDPALKEINGQWVYASGNNIITDYTGLVAYGDTFYYVENGYLNWNYTGLAPYYGEFFYVTDGIINWNYTGLVEYYGSFYYVENGYLNWNYTGLAPYYGEFFYVTDGIINWNYTGLVEYYGTFYYVGNGYLNWSYTGLAPYYSEFFYVTNGVLNWNYTGLVEYYGTFYYVENGYLNWNYAGLAPYYGEYFYVTNGIINWGYTGYVEYYGAYFYITNGYLDWSKQ